MEGSRERLEAEIAESLRDGRHADAARLLLEGYGPEILGFLVARLRNEADASDAFSMFTEDLWRGLPAFERRSTARVWAFTLARNAAIRFQRVVRGRPERRIPLSRAGELSQIEARVRSETLPHLKTDNRDRIAALRAQLSEEEQTLLVLRVDKGFEWRHIAEVFGSTDADSPREAARWRKRFQLVKDKLKRLARDAGMVPTDA